MGLKKFKLIELEESIRKAELPDQIEEIKKKHIKWEKEDKEFHAALYRYGGQYRDDQ